MATHLLYEGAAGYAVFSVKLTEEIGASTKAVQDSITDLSRFGKMVQLKTFLPFRDAAHALENANDVSEGIVNDHLRSLLELHLSADKSRVVLGVSEKGLASSIKSGLRIDCDTSSRSLELVRGIRLHADKLLPGLDEGDVDRAQLGLGHAYSRAKVKFNVNRSDNMIIQAIALLDQLDKDVNTFSMRVREWYGWHFPELAKVVSDPLQYARLVKLLGDRTKIQDEILRDVAEILDDNTVLAQNVLDGARASMGTDISPIDLINILNFADRVIHLHTYRKSLQAYLREKMELVAPNLGALIGDTVAARLISHAGSLTNLSKYPASTVQILGAEKALFRALKTKGNTPKYGLIYHSSFIGRAGSKNKGRISRFLANKCSIASRIDCFADSPSTAFGQALREQVEERLAFYETGANPTKNSAAMALVLASLRAGQDTVAEEGRSMDAFVDPEGNVEGKRKRKKHGEADGGSNSKKSKKSTMAETTSAVQVQSLRQSKKRKKDASVL